LSDDSGRDGTVRIFGGRNIPLPYCDQSGYTYQTAGVNQRGINIDDQSYIEIDGRKWSGIKIYGVNHNGISALYYNVEHDITFRNIEVFDNGEAINDGGVWVPHHGRPGIWVTGYNYLGF